MALQLGQLQGDTLAEMANYLAFNAQQIAFEGEQFIQGLADSKEINFQIGDIPSLGFRDTTYEGELALTLAGRVLPPEIDINLISQRIDELAALTAPAEPSLALPVTSFPELTSVPPALLMPTRPDADVGPAPTDAPAIQDVQPPEAPLITFPNVPTFDELQIPAAPSYTLPTFSAEAPQNQLLAPTMNFDYVDPGYLSELKDPLVAKLLDNLTNGGYGIEPNDEAMLWGRARDRAEQQARIEYEEVQKQSVNTSFPVPQGAYFARLDKARHKVQEALSEINREIALKRSELYVDNRKFTIQEVQKYEERAINLYNAVQERALNFAKASVELGIAIYDAAIRKFNADMEGYKTEAFVFEARVRAELSKAELFKAQIEAESLRGQFNQIKVNLYNAQLQGISTVVNLYKSRVEAANLLAQLQQQKLDAFKSRVNIFSERVRAKQAEFEMYRAGIQGELAKVESYRTEVDAFAKRVEAEEAKGRLTIQQNDVLVRRFESATRAYTAKLEGFAKSVDAEVEKARTQVGVYNVDVAAYRAFVDSLVEGARTKIANQKMNNDWNIAAVTSQVDQVKFRLEQLKLTVDNMNNINRFGAEYFRTALGSTLAGLNGLSVKTEG